jgi:hypothetical protein
MRKRTSHFVLHTYSRLRTLAEFKQTGSTKIDIGDDEVQDKC